MPDQFGMFYLQWSNPLAPTNGYNFGIKMSQFMTNFLENQNWTIQNQQQLEKWQEKQMINDMHKNIQQDLFKQSMNPLNSTGFNIIPSEEKMAQSYSEVKDSTKIKQEENTVEK